MRKIKNKDKNRGIKYGNVGLDMLAIMSAAMGVDLMKQNYDHIEELKLTEEYKILERGITDLYAAGEAPSCRALTHLMNSVPLETYKIFCMVKGMYNVPSKEGIGFVKKHMEGFKNVIEIGAGNGYLSRLLGIKGTDNKCQLGKEMRNIIKRNGQVPLDYGSDIIEYGDLKAIEKLNPDCVVAAWITDMYDPKRPDKGGLQGGVQDWKYIMHSSVKKYIFLGNMNIHDDKNIMNPLFMAAALDDIFEHHGIKISMYKGHGVFSKNEDIRKNFALVIEKTDNIGELSYEGMEDDYSMYF